MNMLYDFRFAYYKSNMLKKIPLNLRHQHFLENQLTGGLNKSWKSALLQMKKTYGLPNILQAAFKYILATEQTYYDIPPRDETLSFISAQTKQIVSPFSAKWY